MTPPRILVVDSDSTHLDHCRTVLMGQGFDVVRASSLAEARGHVGDGIVAALVDPGHMDGEWAALRRDLRIAELPMFGMTALYSGEINRALGVAEDGFAEYWEKPVPASELLAWLRRALGDAFPAADVHNAVTYVPGIHGPAAASEDSRPLASPRLSPRSSTGHGLRPSLLRGSGARPAAEAEAAAARPTLSGAIPYEDAVTPFASAQIPSAAVRPVHDDVPTGAFGAAPAAPVPAPAQEDEWERDPTPLGTDPASHYAEPVVPAALDVRIAQQAGDLRSTTFATVLGRLARSRSSGALMLQRGDIKKLIYFEEGCPVGAKTNSAQETLGQMLHDMHVIDDAQLEAVIRTTNSTGASQGQILLDMGALDEEALRSVLGVQLRRKVHEAFEWESGNFSFRPGNVPANYRSVPPGSPWEFIWEGVQHVVADEVIDALLPAMHDLRPVWIAPRGDAEALGLTRSQRAVMDLVGTPNGGAGMAALAQTGDAVRRFVFFLLAAGFVGFSA